MMLKRPQPPKSVPPPKPPPCVPPKVAPATPESLWGDFDWVIDWETPWVAMTPFDTSFPQPTTERQTPMLLAITILATLKVAPGHPVPSEEIIVPTQEVVANSGGAAVLALGAQFAEAINKVSATHELRIVARSLNTTPMTI